MTIDKCPCKGTLTQHDACALRIARREPGWCQDCGWKRPVRTITFWATGMKYTVCAPCERPYRHVINWPVYAS